MILMLFRLCGQIVRQGYDDDGVQELQTVQV